MARKSVVECDACKKVTPQALAVYTSDAVHQHGGTWVRDFCLDCIKQLGGPIGPVLLREWETRFQAVPGEDYENE